MSVGRAIAPNGRSAVKLVFGLFVALGLILVFAGTLTRSTSLEEQATQRQAEIAALQARADRGGLEVEFVATDEFVNLYARRLGYGEKGETVFRLSEDAPPPPAIAPIGASHGQGQAESPFEAWLALLFGA